MAEADEGDGPVGGDQDVAGEPSPGVLADLLETRRLLLVPLLMATGVALVVHVVSDVPLALALGVTVAILLPLAVVGWVRLRPAERADARRRAAVGVVAGAAGTAAYDGTRWGLAEIADLGFWPYDILEVFGTALVGHGQPMWAVLTAGIALHVVTGVGLAAAYALLLRRPTVWNGIVVGLVLGTFMVVIYPNWIGTEGVFGGFLAATAVGHLVYGAAIGLVAMWLVGRRRPPAAADRAFTPGSSFPRAAGSDG